MPYVLVRHKVEDYVKWKLVFDDHGATRKASGFRGHHLFRNGDDPNELVILFEVDDVERARQFCQSEDLRQAMQRAGVSDQPDIYLLDEVERVSV
jgi:heme-degrading monooxygenase HmoA